MLESNEGWAVATSYSTKQVDQDVADGTELDAIFDRLRALRGSVVDAWQARAVVLSKEEQRELRDEIRKTCDLLTSLVSHD